MADNLEIKSKFANAVFQSLLEHWDQVNPNAGPDREKWDNGEIMLFATRYANEQSDDILREHAQNKDGKLSKPFEKRLLPDAARQYLSFALNASASTSENYPYGLIRGAGHLAKPEPAAAETQTIIVEPAVAEPVAATTSTPTKEAAPTPAAPTPDLAALARLAAISTPTPSPRVAMPQPTTPELVLEPATPSQSAAPITPPATDTAQADTTGSVGNNDQLPPQAAPALEGSDGFSADNIAIPGEDTQDDPAQLNQQDPQPTPDPITQPEPQPVTIEPTDWSKITHIFRTNEEDMARIDAAHQKGAAALGRPRGAQRHYSPGNTVTAPNAAFDNVTAFSPASMAYLAVRYPSYARDPVFLAALHEKAQSEGKTVAELLDTPQIKMQTKEGVKLVDTSEAVHHIYQTNSLLTTPPFAGFERAITEHGIMTKPWYKDFYDWMGGGIESPDGLLAQYKYAGVMFVDSAKNAYVDTGKKVKVILAPREKFGVEHAFNVTRIYMAGRFDPAAPTPQTMKFDLAGGDLKSRILGHRGLDGENLSLMVLSTLAECDRANADGTERMSQPEIRVQKMMGMVPLNRIWFEEEVTAGARPGPNDIILNKTAREEMIKKGINVGKVVRNFNTRNDPKPALDPNDRPTISHPDQKNPLPAALATKNGNGNGHHTAADFTDMSAIAKSGIGKLTEMVLGVDLSKQLERTIELQSEMIAIDKVMQARHDSSDYRRAFVDHYNANPTDGREQVKATFSSDEIEAANSELNDNLDKVSNFKGPEAASVVPTFGAILQNVLIRGDNGATPMDPAQVKKYFEAGAMLQFAARMTQALTTGSAKDFAYPRESASDTKNIALAGQAFALLKNQLDKGTLDTRFASQMVQTNIKQMVHEVQKTLADMNDPRTAALGTLFLSSLSAIADRYKASAPGQNRQPARP